MYCSSKQKLHVLHATCTCCTSPHATILHRNVRGTTPRVSIPIWGEGCKVGQNRQPSVVLRSERLWRGVLRVGYRPHTRTADVSTSPCNAFIGVHLQILPQRKETRPSIRPCSSVHHVLTTRMRLAAGGMLPFPPQDHSSLACACTPSPPPPKTSSLLHLITRAQNPVL